MTENKQRKNRNLVLNLTLLVLGMVMLTYASVPIYRVFCQVTGYGGTTQVAHTLPEKPAERFITVRFNGDIDSGLPWAFKPDELQKRVQVGKEYLTSYTAENLTGKTLTGHAVYNVVPNKAGPYFAKIACFCFTDQTLKPHQKVHMPISFFLDPALMDDREMDDVETITLSYTFFPKPNKTN